MEQLATSEFQRLIKCISLILSVSKVDCMSNSIVMQHSSLFFPIFSLEMTKPDNSEKTFNFGNINCFAPQAKSKTR